MVGIHRLVHCSGQFYVMVSIMRDYCTKVGRKYHGEVADFQFNVG